MNKPFILLTAVSTLLAASAATSFAADFDPGYAGYAPRGSGARGAKASFIYKPTQRYYGKGFTVSYKFLPVPVRSQRYGTSFESYQAQMSSEQFYQWRGKGQPRLTSYQTFASDSYTKPGGASLPPPTGIVKESVQPNPPPTIVRETVQPNLPPVGEAPVTPPPPVR